MDNISITADVRSPEINFNFTDGNFLIKGESYPEDVNEFFGPIIKQLEEYLRGLNNGKINFTFELIYFNSSTAKVLMNLFDLFDEVAEAGSNVAVEWRHDEDDDNMEEMGEEFGEDLEHASFKLTAFSSD